MMKGDKLQTKKLPFGNLQHLATVAIVLLIASFLISGCNWSGRKYYSKQNGFRICLDYREEDRPFELKKWKFLKTVEIEGYLLKVKDPKTGRYTGFVVDGTQVSEPKMAQSLVSMLKRNHPSSWDIWPTSFGTLTLSHEDVAGISLRDSISGYETISTDLAPDLNTISDWKIVRSGGFVFQFSNPVKLKMAIIEVAIEDLNEYLYFDRLDDGPESYYCSPFYQYVDSGKYMKFSLL